MKMLSKVGLGACQLLMLPFRSSHAKTKGVATGSVFLSGWSTTLWSVNGGCHIGLDQQFYPNAFTLMVNFLTIINHGSIPVREVIS